MDNTKRKYGFWIVIVQLIIILIILFSIIITNIKPNTAGFIVYESQPNSITGKDTYITQNFNDTNYGSNARIFIGKDGIGRELRGLIEFNVSNISGTILSAKLQVNLSFSNNNNNITIKAYRLTSPWIESETTWKNTTSSQDWSTIGGDYAELEDSLQFSNVSVLYNFTITNLVRGWVNGSYINYGIILISDDAPSNNRKGLDSSDSASESARPKLTVDYTENAVPTIINTSTNSNLTNLKEVGKQANFMIFWEDMELDNVKAYVCNSSSISFASGCADKTFCSTSLSSANPIQCSYTITSLENRTTSFFSAVCDSNNCSEVNKSYFYMNHAPTILIVQPNGSEIVNQSQGNYLIKFNVSDSDNDFLFADIYYGETQNSTVHLINSSLNLTNFCTDADLKTSTQNNCSYSWNSLGIYGAYYLTIIMNDSYSSVNDSSDSSFNVKSIADNIPPSITAQWTEADIHSGKQVQIYANISDDNIITAWASINTTPQINITLKNALSVTYNGSWTAVAVGNYQFKVYAEDIVGNLNDSRSWQTFSIRKPNATTQNEHSPAIAWPYHTIKITGELNATDSLKDVYAYLNVPEGFTFLSNYPQNSYMGNFSSGQIKNATWFLSAPLTETNYVLNITYTDDYSNTWNSSNLNIQVTSAVGGGYELDVSGYPEVQTGNPYYSEAYFKQSGIYTAPDSIKISIYDSIGNPIISSADMYTKQTGIYNYTYSVPSSQTAGQWETRVNATKNSISYYANQFWKLVGALFDVRNIVIINTNVNYLNISVIVENKGTVPADLFLQWNLTRTDTNQELKSGLETIGVGAGESITKYYHPVTTYVGQVKITFLGRYSGTETAGAYAIFSTTSGTISCGDGTCNTGETCSSCPADCGVCPVTPPGGGGGGGGGEGAIIEEKADLVLTADKIIYIAKNIEKTISFKINNTGEKGLTNISLELENLDKLFYTVSPSSITSLKRGKVKTFEIKFLITEYLGEQEFNYLIKTNELTKKEPGKIIVISILEYLQEEVSRLTAKIESAKSKITTDKLREEIKKCEDIIEEAKSQIDNEEFISARNNIENGEDCIKGVEKQISQREWIQTIKTGDLLWVALSLLILIMIIIVILILRKVYVQLNLSKFLENKEKRELKSEAVEGELKTGTMSERYFEDKIKSIHERLKS